jgi:signal transduction histidine kinase
LAAAPPSPRVAAWVAVGVAGEVLLAVLFAAGVAPLRWWGVPGAVGALIAIFVAIRCHPVIGVLVAAAGGVAFAVGADLSWYRDMAPILLWMVAAGIAGYAASVERERVQRAEAARAAAVGELLQAERRQRRDLAAELHDDTVQVLTAAVLRLDAARRAPADMMAGHIGVASATIREALERTRRLSFELRPPLLDEKGLEATLADLVTETCRETGCTPHCDVVDARFDADTEELVYRVVREALVNVRKHAHADHVWVRVDYTRGTLSGAVRDDGRGFDPTAATSGEQRRLHLGVSAAEERVRLAGGSLTIRAAPGEGTLVSFTVPARPRRAPAAA